VSEEANKGGRPRKIQSPEEFDRLVDEYVEKCREEETPIMWTGMAYYLGFTSRSAIDEYEGYEGFYYSAKRAKLIVEMAYEQRLSGKNPVAGIFGLKNMGWKDKIEQELTANVRQITDEPMDTDAWLSQYSENGAEVGNDAQHNGDKPH